MTSPRTPRQLLGWTVPDHIETTGHSGGFVADCLYVDCGGSRYFRHPDGSYSFREFLRSHAHGVTVEYRPLSEVLPETPEPPREERPTFTPRVLLGWTVPSHIEAEIYQGRFWGLCLRCDGERKVTLDYEAEAVAFLKDHGHGQPVGYRPMPGCCGGCGGDGAVFDPDTNGRCPDCYGTGHMHTGSCDPVPASQSVPAVPVSSTGGKETGEAAETATEALRAELTDAMDAQLRAALAPPDALVFSPILAQAAIEYFVRVGWSPSLPDSETEWQLELEDGYVEQLADEKTAREYVRNGFRVTSRPVGPWTAVQT